MTGWACSCTPSAWNAGGSSGRRLPMVRLPSPRPSSATCWRGLTGAIRNEPGGRSKRAESHVSNDLRCILWYPAVNSSDPIIVMTSVVNPDPDDVAALRAALAAEQQARGEAEARAAGAEAMVAHLKLLIAKLKHDRFGAASERGRKLLDQLELQLEELEATASENATVTAP